MLRDLRSTISQTYSLWIDYKGFAVHGLMYGKSLEGLFRRGKPKTEETTAGDFHGKGKEWPTHAR
ncbi:MULTISPECIES: hypothetical protein [Flavobacteriaceae]|uniref:hypothetical protein n=1 Tax=Flavobacteriaceae TaxID=49546 RepID=UPI000FF70CB1|nr:hypothetical protein [Muricauda sp. MAR_2010_75]RPG31133.1 MAG: hypothetical protein CBB72_012620 [Muricauda sp. TMED12]